MPYYCVSAWPQREIILRIGVGKCLHASCRAADNRAMSQAKLAGRVTSINLSSFFKSFVPSSITVNSKTKYIEVYRQSK